METLLDIMQVLRYFYGKRWYQLTPDERRRIVYHEFEDDE